MTEPALVDVVTMRTTCPVCRDVVDLWGPDGVIPHILNVHPDSLDAKCILTVTSR